MSNIRSYPLNIKTRQGTVTGLVIEGASGQSVDLVEIRDNSTTSRINVNQNYDLELNNVGLGVSNLQLPFVGGGQKTSNNIAQTGYLKIQLPVSWTNTMVGFYIDIYEYNSGYARSVYVSGYNYTSGLAWHQETTTQNGTNGVNIRVDYGHDGTYCAIYISKDSDGAATNWTYPQVTIRDVTTGFVGYDTDVWASGWALSYTATLGTITRTGTAYSQTTVNAGTTDYLPIFSSSTQLVNSPIFKSDSDSLSIWHTNTSDSYVDIYATNTTNTLRLRGGNVNNGTTSGQILMSYNAGASYTHTIQTRHNGGSNDKNAIDMYVWDVSKATSDYPTKRVFSVDAISNICMGSRAGNGLISNSGSDNTLIGTDSGYSMTTGYGNILLGRSTMTTVTDGYLNIAIGYSALYSSKGKNGIAIGFESMYSHNTTSEHQNIAIGRASMYYNQTGLRNTVVGYQAGKGSTGNSYSDNTFIGRQAGYAIQTGTHNSGIGHQALYANTTGTSNISLGASSGQRNTSGTGNCYIGNSSGSGNQGGNSNVTVGASAGTGVSGNSYSYNVFIGYESAYRTTTGQENVTIGYRTGYNNATGVNNTLLGAEAGVGVSGYNNSNNTFLGYQSGLAVTTGSNNIFVGYRSGDNVTTGANNIVIAYDINITSGITSNYLNIGNIITGDLSTGDVDVSGDFTAVTKSFLIDHPTKEGKLQHGSLEGPEHGVYIRGEQSSEDSEMVIILPDYWTGLVDEDSITIQLTPYGHPQPNVFVSSVENNMIIIESDRLIKVYYTVNGTRKDIGKLEVEYGTSL
jgi:hypothetical protein